MLGENLKAILLRDLDGFNEGLVNGVADFVFERIGAAFQEGNANQRHIISLSNCPAVLMDSSEVSKRCRA